MKTTGTEYSQAPTNGDLGTLAFQNADDVNIIGGSMYTNTKTVANHYNDTNTSMVKPTLNLDFAKSKSLDPRVTYSRASTATYYDGSTTALAEQNLLTYSQDFSQSIWLKNAGSVTNISNTIPSPNGTLNASTLSADGSSNIHSFVQVLAVSTGKAMVFSCHIKAGTNYFVQLATNSGQGNMYANFDLSAGTTGSTNAVSSTILSMGNGWYRCSMSFNSISTVVSEYHICLTNSSSDANRQPNTLSTSLYLWGTQLEQRSAVSAYTPTTSTAITNYVPQLMTAANHRPRFDHDPVTRESKGLLIEEARTNLLTYSSDYTNAAWNKFNTVINPAADIAPDGTQTATLVVLNTTSSQHGVYAINTVSATTYTLSCYAKYYGQQYIQLYWFNSSYCNFDIQNGIAGTPTGSFANIQNVGNGWYRCSITFTASVQTTVIGIGTSASLFSGINTVLVGNGYNGWYIWGAQVEVGSFATSYIPTVSSQVTRAADNASIIGVNFSNWWNQSEGSLYMEAYSTNYNLGNSGAYFQIDDTNNTNRIIVSINASNQVLYNMSPGTTITSNVVLVPLMTNKLAISYGSNQTTMSINGTTTSITQTTRPQNTMVRIGLGYIVGYGYNLGGCIKSIRYYPKILSSTELQELTS